MAFALSSQKADAGVLAAMTHVAVSNPTAHTTTLPRSCLYVWVVGNPTSGGERGAVLLDRLEKLFCQSFGRDTVHTASSSNLLHILSLHQPVPGSSSEGMESGEHVHSPEAPSASALGPTAGSAPSYSSAVSAVWNATAAAMPANPPDCALSSVASSVGGVALRTLIIRTNQCGHLKPLSHALSQLILCSRLDDHQRPPQGPMLSSTPRSAIASATLGNDNDKHKSLPLGIERTSATYQCVSSSRPDQPSPHHVILVVGGDGTLSEVTNGLCDGTLAGFAQLALSSGCSADAAAVTSHAHVEREAAVLSHLLPAVLYMPAGTGSDFAKLELCCRTPEDALRVVCDGLARELFPVASSRGCDDVEHVDSEGCRSMALNSPAARQSISAPSRSSACAAYAVDVGRIEFLRTGTRHFFINECSAGMSCDVIQRGERFKHCRWISMLGGLVLFAASSFVSLVLMKPKPVYICKLPPRVPLSAASAAGAEDVDTDGGATETDASQEQASKESIGGNDNYAAGVCSSDMDCKSISTSPLSDAASDSPLGWPHSLTSLAPFTPLSKQLGRLCARLRRSAHVEPRPDAPGHRSDGSRDASANYRTRLAAPAAPAKDCAAAYTLHARTPMPPLHAKKVRCTLQTPSHQILQLLDISPEKLEMHRMQQEQRDTGAPAVTSSTDFTTATSMKGMGRVATSKGTAAATSSGEDMVQHEHVRCKGNAQIGSDDHIGEHRCRGNSGALYVDPATGKGDDAWPRDVGDDDLISLVWVELPSSMIAFANGRWYGGGMLVAPHANPTDGLLSCTNWVTKILPFLFRAFSLYTGGHVRWRSTSVFDGERFLITSGPPPSAAEAMTASLHSLADAPLDAEEALYMEADGEVLEAAPAIVELAGKLIFLVPSTATVCLGSAAPGTTRERVAAQQQQQHDDGARLPSADTGVVLHPPGRRLGGLRDGLCSLLRRLANYAKQRIGKTRS
ncbi:conserved hypothetical protein [Leishmania major strain Friedlin]|uniref:Uncharacterized protein n=1 Tax=Leishmania major TaxID=5664 RepID=Q4QDA8_LEIMA|nr:conserved hypothetical protein [Leishmania major strain Friedlin]CAG9572812.1 Diacylglycerol_kinase_catalytic_domain_containing_protein_-_putative [Leishmania major strain Friedlin]CAJ07198.1 conserved hypothetical protein [Leishmania major strain Friedlin]|eukprot:XP_001682690.1 conserved hypothetical protein [Leishmania major strain Friedlin]